VRSSYGTHGVVDGATGQARLGDHERLALLTQEVVSRHPGICIPPVVHHGLVTQWLVHVPGRVDDLDARRLPWDEGRRAALVGSEDLVHEAQLHLAVPFAPEIGAEMARPEPVEYSQAIAPLRRKRRKIQLV
jgi:hypothetical protein